MQAPSLCEQALVKPWNGPSRLLAMVAAILKMAFIS